VNNIILHFHVITAKLNFNEKLHSGNFPLRKVSEANCPESFQKLSGNFPEIFNTNIVEIWVRGIHYRNVRVSSTKVPYYIVHR